MSHFGNGPFVVLGLNHIYKCIQRDYVRWDHYSCWCVYRSVISPLEIIPHSMRIDIQYAHKRMKCSN